MPDAIELPGGALLRPVRHEDAQAIADAYVANRDYLAPWEPVRPAVFFTGSWWLGEIDRLLASRRSGSAVPLVIEDGDRIVGRFTLTGIERGVFQNSRLGYWVAEDRAGSGLASAAVAAIIGIARDDLGLHRIEASTLPHNAASQRVLAKNGFEYVGLAHRYLRIAGDWRDHHLYQRILHD